MLCTQCGSVRWFTAAYSISAIRNRATGAAAGVPLAKVGDWVGHSDAKITEIYRHASADSEEFALALLDQLESPNPTAGMIRRR